MHPAILGLRRGRVILLAADVYFAVAGSMAVPTFNGEVRRTARADGGDRQPRADPVRSAVPYRYQIDGQGLEGAAIFFGGGEQLGHTAQIAARYLRPYKVGAPVAVFYRSGQPDVSVFQPGFRGHNAIAFGMGVVGTLGGTLRSALVWSVF